MQKGFSVPMILVVLTLVVSVSAISWVYFNRTSVEPAPTVKGASTFNADTSKPGLGVTVTSKNGTWDLVEYACKTLEECTASLEGGKKFSTFGGGTVNSFLVVMPYSPELDEYTYVKYFVKSSFGGMFRAFKVVNGGDLGDTKLLEFKQSGSIYTAVVSPLDKIKTGYFVGATLTD